MGIYLINVSIEALQLLQNPKVMDDMCSAIVTVENVIENQDINQTTDSKITDIPKILKIHK